MTIQIEIKFLKQPIAGQAFAFTIAVNGAAFLAVQKVFGTDITIGANVAATVANVQAHLVANNTVPGVAYVVSGNSVLVNFSDADGYITVYGLAGALDYVHVYELNPEINLDPFEVDLMGIEIIDTYENGRVLIEETGKASDLKLSFDGGDDLYQPLLTGVLSFNMYVPGGQDGHFMHLLTGDERRFMVRLRSLDPDGVGTLLWQGYILPDLYSEPYENNLLFISFTATDMLALLKGKTFKPWYYDNTFNLPELLGYILAETGLLQHMYVSPTLVNVSHGAAWRWRNLNISLRNFKDGQKYDDLYTILEKLLTAQGLQLVSWRGMWHLRGITRRGNEFETVEVYYPDGVYRFNADVQYKVHQFVYQDAPPVITAETPWKKVNVNFDQESTDNLLPEVMCVKDDFFSSYYFFDRYRNFTIGGETYYVNEYLYRWQKVNANFLFWRSREMAMRWFLDPITGGAVFDYDLPEGQALQNYFEALVHPWVVPGRKYELELEISAVLVVADREGFSEDLENGQFDRVAMFQLMLNNETEIMSNRPSYTEAGYWPYEKREGTHNLSTVEGIFILKRSFSVNQSGKLSLRLLAPIGRVWDYGIHSFNIYPKVAKINVLDADEVENAIAVRGINYTKELSVDVDVTCSTDTSIENSFGIANRLADRFVKLPYTGMFADDGEHVYPPTIIYFPGTTTIDVYIERTADLQLKAWPLSSFYQIYIFKIGHQNGLFLRKADGSEVVYNSVLNKEDEAGDTFMAVVEGYTSADGQSVPQFPNTWKYLQAPAEGDELMLMQTLFGIEDTTKRALWKIYGFPDDSAQSYAKTLAYACHAVRPRTTFSIDTQALDFVFPLDLPFFPYFGERRKFIPTRLDIDLYKSTTQITMKEAVLEELTDITFE